MQNVPLFLEHKVKRAIARLGREFTFKVMGVDEYKQPKETEETVTFNGLYHELNSFVSLQNKDAASVQRKKSPMILALSKDIKSLKQGDVTEINGVIYRVNGILDIQNYGVVCDISLDMEV